METVVVVLMILVCFNFMLKQTYRKWWSMLVIAFVCALFVGLIWPYAIEQSKTQIADWLSNPALMLDTSVVLSIEVVLQMAFCMLAAGVLVLIPTGTFVLQRLLPEKELRLELLFLANALIAVLGVITTVNGRTAVTGNTVIDWSALAALTALILVGLIAGFFTARIKLYYKLRKNKEI